MGGATSSSNTGGRKCKQSVHNVKSPSMGELLSASTTERCGIDRNCEKKRCTSGSSNACCFQLLNGVIQTIALKLC